MINKYWKNNLNEAIDDLNKRLMTLIILNMELFLVLNLALK